MGTYADRGGDLVFVVSDQSVEEVARLATELSQAGYVVRTGGINEGSLAEVLQSAPTLVVGTLDRPDGALAAFARQLASMLGGMAPPVIAVSSIDDEGEIRGLLEANVRDVLSRPVLPAVLRIKVAQHLRRVVKRHDPVAGYTVKRLLGTGGMGAVYLATKEGRDVALKVLDIKDTVTDPELLVRFRREAAVLEALKGQGAPFLYEHGRSGNDFYCAMELVSGETVFDALANGPLPFPVIEQLLIDVGNALDKIHQHDLVHRDVKPSNVMLTQERSGDAGGPPADVRRRAKLIDFGLAKKPTDHSLTSSSVILGTPAYIAPEVLMGGAAGAPADAFALGMTALEAAIGTCPMKGSQMDIVRDMAQNRLPDPGTLLPKARYELIRVLTGLLAPVEKRLILRDVPHILGGGR